MMNTCQVIVVRKDLNMRKGKIAAQSAHASMAALLNYAEKVDNKIIIDLNEPVVGHWLSGKFTKICVYVNSEAELLALTEKVKSLGYRHALIQDSGLTEFHNVPTYTALGIGPLEKGQFVGLTDQLPLY